MITEPQAPLLKADDEELCSDTYFISTTSETVSWNDVVVNATVLPSLGGIDLMVIKEKLGYLPAESVLLPHLPFIRALIERFRNSQLHASEFETEIKKNLDFISQL